MAIDFPVGTDFPANGDQIPDGQEYKGFYWDANAGAWKRICAEDQIGDCLQTGQTVCDRLESIENGIIELEEEIDAIAPSVERGLWTMNTSGVVSSQGQMSLYDNDYTNVGNPTSLFKDAKSIWLNELDNDGTPHGFEGVEAGELIELFVQGKAEYGLYEIVEAHDETNGAAQWWVIEVVFVRTLEDASTADNGDIIRVKIFNAPSGGKADEFVLKAGDTMTGALSIDMSADGPASGGSVGKESSLTLKGDRTGTSSSVATVAFDNASSTNKGYLTYRSEKDGSTAFFRFNRDVEIVGVLKTNDISTYSGSIIECDKKMDFTNTGDVNARFRKGFVIKNNGETIDGSNIFAAYNDFVEYNGPTNTDTRIANRKWIWQNTVRDYRTDKTWSETSGVFVNSHRKGKVENPGESQLNKHNYDFVVSATGYGSFYVIGNNAYVRNVLKINCYTEGGNATDGKVVATNSSSRSMMSGMRQAILGATDFESLKSSLLAKLEEMENSNEFSENPTTFDIPE